MNKTLERGISVLTFATLSIMTTLTSYSLPARAAYEQQAAETKSYALKALNFYKQNGKEATRTALMTTPKNWLLGPDHFNLHISALTNDMTSWADSGFAETVGLSWMDVDDLDGVALGKTVTDGLQKSPEGASLQIRFSNPVTKSVAHAEGYCVHADAENIICAWSQTN
jgi:hypothetical protein